MILSTKFLKLLAYFIAAVSIIFSANAEKIILGAENDWYPYTANINGKTEGFTPDLISEVYKLQGIDVEFKSLSYVKCMDEVKNGDLLGCFNSGISDENKEIYKFNKTALFKAKIIILELNNASNKNMTVKDLEGKKVGVTNAYEYGNEFDNNKKIIKDQANSDISTLKKLVEGKVQYSVIYEKVFKYLERKYKSDFQGKLKPAGTISDDGIYIAFSKKFKDSDKYINEFNKGFEKYQKSGAYKKLVNKWDKME